MLAQIARKSNAKAQSGKAAEKKLCAFASLRLCGKNLVPALPG
jgi:hypothetical protein